MVYLLRLAYRGEAYAGWQRQRNAVAVQQVVEEALAELLGSPVRLVGASRTDRGVHANDQAAHLKLDETFPERALVHGTNSRLPPDIRVIAAERMCEGFHALRCARAKAYAYRLRLEPVALPTQTVTSVSMAGTLDLGLLRQATACLPGLHDFTAFALAGGSHTDPHRRILAARWRRQGRALTLRIVGEGFLRGMVRSLVGTLIEVGQGRRAPEDLPRLLAGAPRGEAGPTAPAEGLTLERVYFQPGWRYRDRGRGKFQPHRRPT